MGKRIFPHWIRAYIEHTQHLEAPDAFHFWTAVSTIAGALRRRVWIDEGYFEWVPNFYIIFVAPPGIVSKSTTAAVGMDLLRRVPGIHFGPNVITWQALVQSLAMSTETFILNGAHHPMSAITISASEMGTLINPKDREMIDVLTDLWDGRRGAWDKVTKTQGSDSVQNPWINIIACTTPNWISENVPESVIGGGFASRCVFIFANRKRHLVAYPSENIPANFADNAKSLVRDLEAISVLAGKYTRSADATAWGKEWYEAHNASIPTHLSSDRFGGYLSRKQTHIHKLAMVLAAAQRDALVIERDDLETANKIVTSIEDCMPLVFSDIGKTDAARGAAELVNFVRAHRKISYQATFQHMFRSMSLRDFQAAVSAAMEAGYLTQRQEGNDMFLISNQPAKETGAKPSDGKAGG